MNPFLSIPCEIYYMNPQFCRGILLALIISAAALGMLAGSGLAETECKVEDCKITITIKIAFSYNESEIESGQVSDWVRDIEDVWNGPDGFRTTGDCDCELRYRVESMKITNPSQANCNPGPPGYHCIMITDYEKNPPRNQTSMQGAEFYRGYMYNPSQGGASANGWWSDLMDEPHPDTGADCHDAAHEAGHMMGLDDDYDKDSDRYGENIMGQTSGEHAKPTQDQIDQTVKNVCGEGACPDRCCCGNGLVEDGKGEQCDPFAQPTGCPSGEACCPICCSCYAPYCVAANGEHATQETCMAACTEGSCYFNYQTGCWDCLKPSVVVEQPVYDPEQAREEGQAFHQMHGQDGGLEITQEQLELVRRLYNENIGSVPQVRDLLANERINFHVEGMGCVAIVNRDGVMESIEPGEMPDPTMNMYTDVETLEDIMTGETEPLDALKEGRIWYEGVGFFNWLRFAFAGMLFNIASALGLV
jgi:hypothetical protein